MSTWTLNDGRVIKLLTLAEFERRPVGSVFTTINGARLVKGQDDIDLDTRGSYLAFGIVQRVQQPAPSSEPAPSLRDGNAVQVYEGDGQAPLVLLDEYRALEKEHRLAVRRFSRGAGAPEREDTVSEGIVARMDALWKRMTEGERHAVDPRRGLG